MVEAEIRDLNDQIVDLKQQLSRNVQTLDNARFNEAQAKEAFQAKS